MIVTIDNTSLCAGLLEGEAFQWLAKSLESEVQILEHLRAASKKPVNRDGRLSQFGFRVTREHASAGAAEAFVFQHEIDVPREGDVKCTCQDDSGGSIGVYTLPNACVQSIRLVVEETVGCSTTHDYTIVSSLATGEAPEAGAEETP